MRSFRAALLIAVAGLPAGAAQADPPLLQDGSYEVVFRLELPHLERWAIEKTVTICVAGARPDAIPLPVLSDHHPFATCLARNIRRDGAGLSFDIVCGGRDAAKAHAGYSLAPGAFSGRIAMTMGAKNMTMTEVQRGRRLGSCDHAGLR
jgi:hypothetical protein